MSTFGEGRNQTGTIRRGHFVLTGKPRPLARKAPGGI